MLTIEILNKKAQLYGYRSWFPKNAASLPNYSLNKENFFKGNDDAIKEAQNINCIWFDGELNMPALFKICSENIIEGLYRLNNVKQSLPPFISKYILITDDDYYQIALEELSKPTFKNSQISVVKKSELLEMQLN